MSQTSLKKERDPSILILDFGSQYSELIIKLSNLNTLEDALLLLERFNKPIAEKLFQNLSNMIEMRSLNYVNRYVKTDLEIASIIFDKKRKIRWAGINGNKYISYFQ